MSRLALLLLATTSCGGATTPDRPPPACTPGSLDITYLVAPPDREFPECTEMPAHQEQGSTSRAWCCWKDEVGF